MPSRPVLIGRGLVPTTYKTTHTTCVWVRHAQPTNTHAHKALFASTTQFPTNKPVPHQHGVWELVEVERVTAAIAKRETPGPIPNPEVKPFSADGTATERLWESRTPPDKHLAGATSDLVAPAPFLARYE